MSSTVDGDDDGVVTLTDSVRGRSRLVNRRREGEKNRGI